MKATEAKFLDFLKKFPRFVIFIYRRTWSWTMLQCRQLWNDILHAGYGFHLAGYKIFNQPGRRSGENTARRHYE